MNKKTVSNNSPSYKKASSKVSTRTALVYTGAAILIVVVGLRTLLQMTDEGFGLVEYITIGALGIEFSVLLLYAFTIYSAGKEETIEERFSVDRQDMPEVANEIRKLSDLTVSELKELKSQNIQLQKQYIELSKTTDRLRHFADGDLDKSVNHFVKFSEQSIKILNQLNQNEKVIQKHAEEINKFSTDLNRLIDEQISIRIRQELQNLLSSSINVKQK